MEAARPVIDVRHAEDFFRSLPLDGHPRRPDPETLAPFDDPELSEELAKDERYCPVIECGFATKIYSGPDLNIAAEWLENEWQPLLSITPGELPIETWHRMVTTRWRLFEANFGLPLAWQGFQERAELGSPYRFSYEKSQLGAYYAAAYKFYSTGNECAACRGVEWGPCHAFSQRQFRRPSRDGIWATADGFPNTALFNAEQMMAWSIAVAFMSLVVMGKIMGDNICSVSRMGYAFLHVWEPELVQRLSPPWAREFPRNS